MFVLRNYSLWPYTLPFVWGGPEQAWPPTLPPPPPPPPIYTHTQKCQAIQGNMTGPQLREMYLGFHIPLIEAMCVRGAGSVLGCFLSWFLQQAGFNHIYMIIHFKKQCSVDDDSGLSLYAWGQQEAWASKCAVPLKEGEKSLLVLVLLF